MTEITNVVELTPESIKRAGKVYDRLLMLGKEYRKESISVRDCKSMGVSLLLGLGIGMVLISTIQKLQIFLPIGTIALIIFISALGCLLVRTMMYHRAKKRADLITNEITGCLKENEGYIELIPQKYRYPLACNYMAEVIQCGRADNLKEAMNLYEEQLHRWKIEKQMGNILDAQQRNNAALWALVGANVFFR